MEGYALEPKPNNANPGHLVASLVAAAGEARLYGFTVYSTKATAQFVQVFDDTALPANGAVPLFSRPVAANNFVSVYYGLVGRAFYSGIVIANSSTDATLTLGSADCFVDVQWC